MSSEVAVEMYGGRWKRYPAYKDLGVEWLWELPEGWETKALKRTFKTLNGSTPKSGELDYWDGDIHWATPDDLGQLKGNTLQTTQRMITKEGYNSCGTSLAPSGSLVLSTRAPIGHLAIAGTTMCTNQGCRCLVFRVDDDTHYFYYQLLAARSKLKSLGQGSTFKELSRGNLEAVYLTTPPLPEQRAISTFLDRETGRIETLIEKKARQIELLQEKRAALISHAVTKGLDPDVKMKDSGVEWLGEVPKHWNIERFKYCATLINEKVDGHESILPYTGLENIESWTGRLISHEEVSTSEGQSNRFEIGDVLFGKLRPYLAKVLRAKEHGICTGELLVLRPKDVSQDYLFRYILTHEFISIVDSSTYGAKMPRANWDFIGDLPVLLPTEGEQGAIAAFLDRKTGRIDILTEKVHESISKLREYRTALISAAVNGNIDVRNKET